MHTFVIIIVLQKLELEAPGQRESFRIQIRVWDCALKLWLFFCFQLLHPWKLCRFALLVDPGCSCIKNSSWHGAFWSLRSWGGMGDATPPPSIHSVLFTTKKTKHCSTPLSNFPYNCIIMKHNAVNASTFLCQIPSLPFISSFCPLSLSRSSLTLLSMGGGGGINVRPHMLCQCLLE